MQSTAGIVGIAKHFDKVIACNSARIKIQSGVAESANRRLDDALASYDEFVECSIDPLMLHFDCVVS